MTAAAELSVSRRQALGWRLERQLLAPVGDLPVGEVVRRLGAVLSMDDTLAGLAIGTRRREPAPGEPAAALARGEVVKAFAFRGAVHYLSPEDGGAYLAVRCAGRQWELPSWQEHYGLSPADWPAFREAVRDAVADGSLTVDELGARLTARPAYRHLRPVFERGAWTLLKPLTWQGDVSLGPPRDGRATLRRLDGDPRWVGGWDLDVAGRHVIRQYLAAYGPAGEDLLHYWLCEGLSAGARRLRGWLADLADELVTVDLDGRPRLLLRVDAEPLLASRPVPTVRLVPGHDQWVMGPGTKDQLVVPPEHRAAATRKADLVLVDGVVRGTWALREDRLTVTCAVQDRPLHDELAEQAARLAAILGRPLQLTSGAG